MDALAPSSFEIAFMVASIVAVTFAVYAIRKISTHQWSVAAGLTLIVLTFAIPFAGPVLVAGLRIRERIGPRGEPSRDGLEERAVAGS